MATTVYVLPAIDGKAAAAIGGSGENSDSTAAVPVQQHIVQDCILYIAPIVHDTLVAAEPVSMAKERESSF